MGIINIQRIVSDCCERDIKDGNYEKVNVIDHARYNANSTVLIFCHTCLALMEPLDALKLGKTLRDDFAPSEARIVQGTVLRARQDWIKSQMRREDPLVPEDRRS